MRILTLLGIILLTVWITGCAGLQAVSKVPISFNLQPPTCNCIHPIGPVREHKR